MPSTLGRTFGENWREAREESGIGSPEQVSELLATLYPSEPKKCLSRNYIYELERGVANPTLNVMQLLADTYGTPLARIFTVGELAPSQDALPTEYRPLEAVLRPLAREDRESIVRNLAASVAMQARVFGGVTTVTARAEVRHETESRVHPYTRATPTNDDELRDYAEPAHGREDSTASAAPSTRRVDGIKKAREAKN